MIYTGDPRRIIYNADRWYPFVVETPREPIDIQYDRNTEILTIHFDPYEAQANPGCPLCFAPITRTRLFDVNQYTIDIRPMAWQAGIRSSDIWKITAHTRAVEFSPCPHAIIPYTRDWYHNYTWPTIFVEPWPVPRDRWAEPNGTPRGEDDWTIL